MLACLLAGACLLASSASFSTSRATWNCSCASCARAMIAPDPIRKARDPNPTLHCNLCLPRLGHPLSSRRTHSCHSLAITAAVLNHGLTGALSLAWYGCVCKQVASSYQRDCLTHIPSPCSRGSTLGLRRSSMVHWQTQELRRLLQRRLRSPPHCKHRQVFLVVS